MTAPIALEQLETAFSTWVTSSTGAAPYFVEPADSGAPIPAPPAAQISWFGLVQISKPQIVKIPSIMVQRYTVTAAGAGTVGVDFSLGFTETPTAISITAGGGDTEDTSAAALLAELTAELPAGVTAAADPEDTASVLVTGSTAQPLFASTALGITSVTTVVQRYPELEAEWSRMTWRTSWRSSQTRGFLTAGDLLLRARKDVERILRPAIRALGWDKVAVIAALTPSPTRGDSTSQATLDLSLEGWATRAYQDPAARLAGPPAITVSI